jgi:FixJ family two-component response regulator
MISETSCLVLDVGLPGMSGPDLQLELTHRGLNIPIVFITAQGEKWLRPSLLSRGAAACLFKPFSDNELLDAVNDALGAR